MITNETEKKFAREIVIYVKAEIEKQIYGIKEKEMKYILREEVTPMENFEKS